VEWKGTALGCGRLEITLSCCQDLQQHKEEDEVNEDITIRKPRKVKRKNATDAQRQEKLRTSGPCPAGFDWDRRQGVSFRCTTHGGVGCGRSVSDGYQCQGQSHWLCIKCIDSL
jgi:hypothetical protein